MSLLPIDTVHGDHRIDRNVEPALIATQDFAPSLPFSHRQGRRCVSFSTGCCWVGQSFEAQLGDGKVRLLDARTAKPLPRSRRRRLQR